MKTIQLLPLILCALIAASSSNSFAQGTPAEKPEHPGQRQGGGQAAPKSGSESRLLQHLLEMDDTQLSNIRQTLERIGKMSPEEKQKMRKRIGKMHDMPPEKVEAMRNNFKAIPQEQRKAMRERWMKMTPEDREAWRNKLREMSPEARKTAFKEQGFLAPPPKRDKKGLRTARADGSKKQHQPDPKPDSTEEIEEN
ncbi:MAG: hypothetical protein ACI9JZ_000536 [Lentimonas sp.]|jgi:hypothetical protein